MKLRTAGDVIVSTILIGATAAGFTGAMWFGVQRNFVGILLSLVIFSGFFEAFTAYVKRQGPRSFIPRTGIGWRSVFFLLHWLCAGAAFYLFFGFLVHQPDPVYLVGTVVSLITGYEASHIALRGVTI